MIESGYAGRNSDGGIFKASAMKYWIIHGGFDILSPSPLTYDETNSPFSYYFAADEAFQKFQILNGPIRCRKVESVNDIIKAVCVLHNYIRKREGIVYRPTDTQDHEIATVVVKSKSKANFYLKEFPNETFKSDGEILFYSCCEKAVSINQRFSVTQHISTSKHKQNRDRKKKFQQNFLNSDPSTSSNNLSAFNTDLCRMLIRADIPIFKLKNLEFTDFLEKYTGQQIPDESTIRKNYVNIIYEETLQSIRQCIQDGPIWVSIDESTDVEGRYFAKYQYAVAARAKFFILFTIWLSQQIVVLFETCRYSATTELIKLKFTSLSFEKKIKIKSLGRPLPTSFNLTQESKKGNKNYQRRFNTELFQKYKWLCGCETTVKLFFFPCVCFGGDLSWSKTGVTDLIHLLSKISKDENSFKHLQNEANLKILEKILNCVKFFGNYELPLRGHNEKVTSKNQSMGLSLQKKFYRTPTSNYHKSPLYFGNVIIGKLCSEPTKSFLLNCVQLEKCNNKTIAKLFNDSMNLLWPNGVKYENVFLFLTDAASYMVKAGSILTAFFPKLVHLTCLVHGFHRVSVTIRCNYSEVDQLIATIKKIFLKAPSRVSKFKEMYPDLNLPPEPIITRWGTWLEAVQYYCDHFDKIKNVISNFDTESATAIEKANSLMQDINLKNNLTYISANFCFLIQTIKQLETKNMFLIESISIVEKSANKSEKSQGHMGENSQKQICKYH
ncbi:hypothetical protein QTP88_017776 [Uroleucon formosanum]